MARGLPTFTRYPDWPPGGLPVGRWQPGLSAVPEDVIGSNLRAELAAIGFDSDRPEDIRTGLLTSEWNGHPEAALVVATAAGREPGGPFAVTDTPVEPPG